MSTTMTGDLQVAVLAVGGEAFAVRIASIKEIVPDERPRPLHGAPAHVVGVIRLRGTVPPVTDLAVLLGGVRSQGTARRPSSSSCPPGASGASWTR